MYEPRIFEPNTLFDSWEPAAMAEDIIERHKALGDAGSIISQPERRTFELPSSAWVGMVACYVIFFAALAVALGGSAIALFMIAISAGYTAIYFGAGTIVSSVSGDQPVSPLERGEHLQTWTGPMDAKAVYGQMLAIPVAVAFFGIVAAAIVTWTF